MSCKDLKLMEISMKRSSSGKHQPSATDAQDKLLTSHLAKGRAGLLRSQLLPAEQLLPSCSRAEQL